MKKQCNRIISLALSVFIFIGGIIFPIRADENTEDDKIRVGFYLLDGYQYYNSRGEHSGYGVDYLNLISNFTGWNYEYVEVNTYSEALNKLNNGSIDLVAPIPMNAEWDAEYLYSEYQICMGRYVLVCNINDNRFTHEELTNVDGVKVAVPNGYPITYEFINFIEEKGLDVELVYYSTPEAANVAMKRGDVDCSVNSLMAIDDNEMVITQFSAAPLYFVTTEDDMALMDKMNEAMQKVTDMYSRELSRMEQNHFPYYTKQFFTREEMEFINSVGTIRVSYLDDLIPISFKNEQGESDGVTRRLMEEISRLTGLKFEYVKVPVGQIDRNFFHDNRIDLLTSVENNKTNSHLVNMYLSIPYMETERVFVSKDEKKFNLDEHYKVAISSGSQTFYRELASLYPNVELVYYDTVVECFEAVRNNRVDFLLDSNLNVEYYITKPLYSEFFVVSEERVSEEFCFATFVFEDGNLNEDECRMLMRILDKAILELSSGSIEQIKVEETIQNRYEYTVLDTFYKYRYVITVGILGIIGLLCAGIYTIANNQRHIKKHKSEAAKNLIQKKRYELVMDGSDDMIYEIGAKFNGDVSSDKIKETFGWDIPKKVDRLDFDTWVRVLHIHRDDEDVLYSQYGRDLVNNGLERATVQLQNLNNNDFLWCEISVVPLRDENGELISLIGKISNVDAEVRSIEAQGKVLEAANIKSENLEELLVNALTDNVANILKINLKDGNVISYKVKENMILEEPFEFQWNDYYSMLVKAMSAEDALRIGNAGMQKVLARQHVGTIHTYHFKAKYDIRNRVESSKYHFYTTKCSIVEINGEKFAIVTSVDDTEIMQKEKSYNEQREEFTSKLFESQRFLFSAMSGTYITTLKIALKDEKVYGMEGSEKGILVYSDLKVKWSDYLDKELIPYLDKLDVEKFIEKASIEALRKREVGEAITVSFKAKVDPDNLDPINTFNWFVINFRILEERGEKVATVIFQCDTENVQREILKNREREARSRQKRLEALVDRTEDVVFEIDLENKECIVTGRIDNLYGWELNRVISDISIEKIIGIWGVHPEDRFIIGEAVQSILSKEISVNRDLRIQKKNGTYIWSRISAVPVINDNSEITAIICKVTNIAKEVEEKKMTDHGGRMDTLTGLLTKNSMIEVTEKYLREHSAKNDAFIIIDMDQMKSINVDSRISDKVLKDIAKKLQIIFSNYDYIGKYEGDMFCVFVKNIPADTLEDKLEWALEKLRDSYTYNGKIVEVTASIGVAYSMAEQVTYEELYSLADETVYEAKKSGKGGFAVKRFF